MQTHVIKSDNIDRVGGSDPQGAVLDLQREDEGTFGHQLGNRAREVGVDLLLGQIDGL